MAKKSRFVYRGEERTSEETSRWARQSSGDFDRLLIEGIPSMKVTEGEHTYRILPPTWDTAKGSEEREKWGNNWHIEIWVHYNIGPDSSAFLCLDKMKGEPCPICEAQRNAETKKEADNFRAKRQNLCWAIDRDDTKAGPQVWRIPPSHFRDIINRTQDKKTQELLLIDSPDDGYDVYFERVEQGDWPKYEKTDIDRDPSPLHDKEPMQEKWLDYVQENPLPSILLYAEPDYIEKVLEGKVFRDEDEDEDEDARPPRKGRDKEARSGQGERTGSSARRGRDEDEDEDSGDRRASRGSGSRGRDEDERPSSRNRRGRDEDEENGEEDEKPRDSSRRATTSERRAKKDKEDEGAEEPKQSARARDSMKWLKPKEEDEPEDDDKDEDADEEAGDEDTVEEKTSSRKDRVERISSRRAR